MNTFFTSDTHFCHANILRYCNRPQLKDGDLGPDGNWISREIANSRRKEMDEFLIEKWNSVVKKGDTVYHMGDFAFANIIDYMNRLNGHILFTLGNHDKQLKQELPVRDLPYKRVITINNRKIVLSHFAMRVWDNSHFNSWHLYGHSHGTLTTSGKSFDVGVDAQNYTPISFEEVEAKMKLLPDNSNVLMNFKRFNTAEYKEECEREGGEPIYRNHL